MIIKGAEELFLVISLIVDRVAVPLVVEGSINPGGVDPTGALRHLLNVHCRRRVHLDRFDIIGILHSQLRHPDLPFFFVVKKILKTGILEVDPLQLNIEPLEPQPELGHKV